MAVPADQDLTITRGDTETIVVTLTSDDNGTPINITGRTYRAQIRQSQDATTIKASFTCAITNAAAGQVTCTLSATDSATLPAGYRDWETDRKSTRLNSSHRL